MSWRRVVNCAPSNAEMTNQISQETFEFRRSFMLLKPGHEDNYILKCCSATIMPPLRANIPALGGRGPGLCGVGCPAKYCQIHLLHPRLTEEDRLLIV